MSLAIFSLIFACITNITLGLLVFIRNPKSSSAWAFLAISTNISAWTVSNFLVEYEAISLTANNFFNRLAFFFAFLAVVSICLFCYTFPKRHTQPIRKKVAFLLIVLPISILSLTPLVTGNVTRGEHGLEFSIGELSLVYILALLILLISGMGRLIKTKRTSKSVQVQRQAIFMVIGFASTVILALLTNLIIPIFNENFETARLGPLLTVILVGSIAYAIVRHGLFDIRFVIARSLAYIMLIATVAISFAIILIGVSSRLIGSQQLTIEQEVIYIITALLIGFTFQPLKKLFDRITNKLFYRDAYDAQQFISELNKNLVTNVDIDSMLHKSVEIIEANLKASYCLFSINETSYLPRRNISLSSKQIEENDFKQIDSQLSNLKEKVMLTDFLDSSDDREITELLRTHGIAVIVRLTPETEIDLKGIGYLILGQKKSGNPYNSQDIKMLNIIANELVIAIQNALRFEEIEKFNITLQEKVDTATRKLRQNNEKLRQLDETKDEFISMASHQLRTPLTSVKGYLSMIIEGDAGDISAMQKKLLDQAFISSQRMVYLIADLLNVSRLQTGKFIIEPNKTNLSDLVEGEVNQLVPTAKGRGLELNFTPTPDFPVLMLDETKIRQVVMNFIDNAIYYTPRGGTIDVALEDKPDSVEMRVTDTGLGVPKGEQQHLFSKFFRAGNAKKARPDGTGLGLFMAKKVIVAQGGNIIFSSKENEGSTFGFSFPKAKLMPPPEEPKPEELPPPPHDHSELEEQTEEH